MSANPSGPGNAGGAPDGQSHWVRQWAVEAARELGADPARPNPRAVVILAFRPDAGRQEAAREAAQALWLEGVAVLGQPWPEGARQAITTAAGDPANESWLVLAVDDDFEEALALADEILQWDGRGIGKVGPRKIMPR